MPLTIQKLFVKMYMIIKILNKKQFNDITIKETMNIKQRFEKFVRSILRYKVKLIDSKFWDKLWDGIATNVYRVLSLRIKIQ